MSAPCRAELCCAWGRGALAEGDCARGRRARVYTPRCAVRTGRCYNSPETSAQRSSTAGSQYTSAFVSCMSAPCRAELCCAWGEARWWRATVPEAGRARGYRMECPAGCPGAVYELMRGCW
ncbi:Tyrosine-protein kinase Abl, partial [Operophtera brumata]